MPEFPSTEDFGGSDVDLMQQFVSALWDLLHRVVEGGADFQGQPLFEPVLQERMYPALMDTRPHFDRLQAEIPEIDAGRISDHALEGQPLRFKLSVVRHWYDRFVIAGGTGLFRRLLDALEGLLDSIIDAAQLGGAVKEIKEAIRNSTSD